MHHLEIKHFRLVCAVAQTGNMTRAAENLFLSQSALSQQLKDIETKLGVDLFFRASKKMILTPVGKKLLDTAERVIRIVEDTELDIARMNSGDQGELKVGVQCLFCFKWLPTAIEILQKTFPKVELVIGMAEELREELESGKFDCIITAAPAVDERLHYVELFADKMVCVLPVDHPLCGQSYIRAEDFGRYNLISHAERERNRLYQAMLKIKNIEPKRYITIAQPQAMVEMVAAGLGIAVFPAWAIREAVGQGRVTTRPLTAQGVPLTWHAVSLPGQAPIYQEEFVRIVGRMKVERGATIQTVEECVV